MQISHQDVCFLITFICLFDLLVFDFHFVAEILLVLLKFLNLLALQWHDRVGRRWWRLRMTLLSSGFLARGR